MQYPSTSRAQSQGFVQPNTCENRQSLYSPPAAGLHHGLEACMGTGRLRFSIPDTTLRRKCPDAWALRPPRCPVKTDWVARPQAREGKSASSSAALCRQLLLALGTPQGPRGLKSEDLNSQERASASAALSLPDCMQVARVLSAHQGVEGPGRPSLKGNSFLPPSSCLDELFLKSKSVWFMIFIVSSGKSDLFFHIRFSFR